MKGCQDWKLSFNDGTWQLVTAPVVLRNGVMVARMARAYHRELLRAIAGQYIWPVSHAEELALFTGFREYYLHLAEWVIPGIDPGDLTWESRHEFFVATESHPDPNPANEGQVRGLSGIEQLLGYSYPEREPDEEPDKGAGDSDLSTLAIALLTFQHHDVLGMAHVMSGTDLASVVGYANRKLKEAQEAAENKDKDGKTKRSSERSEEPSDADDDKFRANKQHILEALATMEVEVPAGF